MSRARDIANIGDGVTAADITDATITAAKMADGAVEGAFTTPIGRRNLIINGAMQVAQRGTSTSSVSTTGYYAVDRFKVIDQIATAVTTVSQSTDAPDGFQYSKQIDVTTANGSPSAGEYFLVQQIIEAQNVEQLQYGTSGAKSLTLSFWVKSSKTGTHYAEIENSGGQFFSKPYTISSANTWEHKTITYAGNTGQALINSGANSGIGVNFWLVAGSAFQSGTQATTWSSTNGDRLVGQVNVLDNTANNFYLTGVQLEVGSVATPFEHRSYGEELALCQRYYRRLSGSDVYCGYGVVRSHASTVAIWTGMLIPSMRSAPAIDGSNIRIYDGATMAITSWPTNRSSTTGFWIEPQGSGGLTSGNAGVIGNNNSSVGYIEFDSEL